VPGSLVGGDVHALPASPPNRSWHPPLMPAWLAIAVFVASLVATLSAAGLFARRLDTLGHRLAIAEPLVGLLTALAADAPELSSGATAIARGHTDVGVGVLLGSNMFNLAAMIGLSAIVAGRMKLERAALVREGAVALLAVAAAAGVLAGVLSPWLALAVLLAVAVPYLRWLGGTRRGAQRGGGRWQAGGWMAVVAGVPRGAGAAAQVIHLFVLELPALAIIVLGSVGMVASAVDLAARVGMSQRIVGLAVLATLTSLPNAFTAVRLGRAGRSSALVSETLNSNTINLLGGVILPSLFVSLASGGRGVGADVAAVVALTVACLVMIGRREGAGRPAGCAIVAGYLLYIGSRLALG
jgi:cation:H+ antiporter